MKKHSTKIIAFILCLLVFLLPVLSETNGMPVKAVSHTEWTDRGIERLKAKKISITAADGANFYAANGIRSFTAMGTASDNAKIDKMQVVKRMKKLGLKASDFNTPAKTWKTIYNRVYQKVVKPIKSSATSTVLFEGKTVSELNGFLAGINGKKKCVVIRRKKLTLDESLVVPSNIHLYGNEKGTTLTRKGEIDKAVRLDNVKNVVIGRVKVSKGCNYGFYAIKSRNFMLTECRATGASRQGIALMGENVNFILRNCTVTKNKSGGVYIGGNAHDGVVENMTVLNNKGNLNFMAGIVLSSIDIKDYETTDNPFRDKALYKKLSAPNRIVFYKNKVKKNFSSGIYSDGGYRNFFVRNELAGNDKEGICLDFGSFGNYVSANQIRANGRRIRQTNKVLKDEFVYSYGKLSDGSSPAKLPGISLDNAAYNVLCENSVTGNYGSGIKTVRSAFRNAIVGNTVSNNNAGNNNTFHFFGIELGYAKLDEAAVGLNSAPAMENAVCKNMVSGGHFSGLFMQSETRANDIFSNIITTNGGAALENHSAAANTIYGNLLNP